MVTFGHMTMMAVMAMIRHSSETMIHANHMALFLQKRSYGWSKFCIAGIGIFDLFAPVTLTLIWWPTYTNLTHIPWRYSGCANMNFLCQGFESYHLTYIYTDRQTRPKLHTTPLRGWSTKNKHLQLSCLNMPT